MKDICEAIDKRIMEDDMKNMCNPPQIYPKYPGKSLEFCELAIYNFIMETKPDEWPNLYSSIVQKNIIDILKKIAGDVKNEMVEKLQYFYDNVNPFLKDANIFIEDIDKFIEEEKIKHNCEYIK